MGEDGLGPTDRLIDDEVSLHARDSQLHKSSMEEF